MIDHNPLNSADSRLVSILVRPSSIAGGHTRTIESLVGQSWPHWEAIVIASMADALEDGGAQFRGDPRIRQFPTAAGSNACDAYNSALETCRGRYVGSVEAGDRLHRSRLELQVQELERRPEIDLLGTSTGTIERPDGNVALPLGAPASRTVRPNRLAAWYADPLEFSSLLVRRDVHTWVGGLDPALSSMAPAELLARCLARGLRGGTLPAVLTQLAAHSADERRDSGDGSLLVERAFIFSVHLAPAFLHAGRHDLLARGLLDVADRAGSATGNEWAAVVSALRCLIGWSGSFDGFRDAFLAACDPSRVTEALAQKPTSSAPTASARPSSIRSRPPLVIIDDYFPNLNTAFRVAEFNDYLEQFDCEVLSTYAEFDRAHEGYAEHYPHFADRVKPFSREELAGRSCAYLVFVHNAWQHLPDLEAARLPFAYTLYPGLELYDPVADLMLQTVSQSPRLHRVVTTQHVTLDYYVNGQFGDPDLADLIWGITVPTSLLELPDLPRLRYGREKDTVDVCFTAHRYMPGGFDKGYDSFVEVARVLASESQAFRFHVVGGMTPDDAALGELASRFTFYPPQLTRFFPEFYRQIDVILSPNRPFTRRAGGFDGFPTGCCIDASLCGVAICCTDAFGENRYFQPGEAILVTPQDVDEIAASLHNLPHRPESFEAIGAAGRARSRELYSVRAQLEPRRDLIRGLLEEGGRPL
ncbi:MAG: glycosyltransferase [Acidobacteria bacterium]|nr:glycosyltransferase [Acidobacteriota bacterium]